MHARAHASSILSSVRQLHRSGTDIIGSITIEKLEEIAKLKLPDLNCEAAASQGLEEVLVLYDVIRVAAGIGFESA